MTPIAPICRRNLFALARAYGRQERIKLATVWRHAYGDAKIGDRLRRGGSVSIATYDELVSFFHNALGDRMPALEPLNQPTQTAGSRPANQEQEDGEARSS